MIRAEDDKFYRLIHRRLRFRGQYDGYKHARRRRDGHSVFSIVFINVRDTSDNLPFRDHVHIKVPQHILAKVQQNHKRGDWFEFTAEVYEYLKQPITDEEGLIYRPWSIGLRDMTKLTPLSEVTKHDSANHEPSIHQRKSGD